MMRKGEGVDNNWSKYPWCTVEGGWWGRRGGVDFDASESLDLKKHTYQMMRRINMEDDEEDQHDDDDDDEEEEEEDEIE